MKEETMDNTDTPVFTHPGLKMLLALNASGKHIYAGTVSFDEVQRRRKANRVARKQRKVNRQKGK